MLFSLDGNNIGYPHMHIEKADESHVLIRLTDGRQENRWV